MEKSKPIRFVMIAAILLLGVYWSVASAISGEDVPQHWFPGYRRVAGNPTRGMRPW